MGLSKSDRVLSLIRYWVLLTLLMLLGFGYWLSKEVVLSIDMRDGREPDEALVGASSLSSQGLSKKGSP